MQLAYVTETFPPEINGVALTVERTVRFLRSQGHAVELIRPRQRGEPAHDGPDEWLTAGAPIPMYPDLRLGLASVGRLQRRFSARRPALVHVATQGPLGRAAVLAASRLGIPVTTDFRTNFHWYSRYYRLGWLEPLVCGYLRGFHRHADATFVPTRAVRAQLLAQGFERIEVQGRGVDTAQFSPARRSAALRALWGAAPSDDDVSSGSTEPAAGRAAPVMLYVGRLAAEKNVGLALRAFEAARTRVPATRMVVVGDGPLRDRLEAEFPAARFVGMQRGEALAAHYASADVFLFPSLSETFGNVTLEALASGLAVLAFDDAAAAEHIRHGRNGLLAAPGDDAAFVDQACRLAASPAHEPALLPALRTQAREAALTARWDAVLGRFEGRLQEFANRSTPTPVRHAVLA